MTIIVSNCASKKELKLAARDLNSGAVRKDSTHLSWEPVFQDPSIFPGAINHGEEFRMSDMAEGTSFICTNHPKRSWFAEVTREAAGKFKVS